jgi:protocatechuate 3,4-dioxygenase beta subunit
VDPTPSNILGPFYRGPAVGYEPAPDRTVLSPVQPVAAPLQFNFMVRTISGGVVAGYRIEIWHADGYGFYDLSNPRPPDTPLEFWPNTAFYRTDRFIYNGKGRSVWTVVPGAYVDPSSGPREPHLHVIVRAPGRPPLTTQVFIPRDPGLPPSQDPYYQPQNTLSPYFQPGATWIGYFVFRIV